MDKGIFMNYRRGKHTQRNKQILIKIEGVDDRNEAAHFVGRKVVWSGPKGTALIGKIIGVHGRRRVVRARFGNGLPVHALGAELTIR